MRGKSADVHFVNNSAGGRALQGNVSFPIISTWIHDDAFHRARGFDCSAPVVTPGNGHAAAIGIEKNLGGIETQTTRGIPWAEHAVTVQLSRVDTRHEYMPVVRCPVCLRLQGDYTARRRIVLSIEQK